MEKERLVQELAQAMSGPGDGSAMRCFISIKWQ